MNERCLMVCRLVANRFNLSVEEMLTGQANQRATARRIAMFVLHATGMQQKEIAREFRRHPSNVIMALAIARDLVRSGGKASEIAKSILAAEREWRSLA
jgi:chromosomal replication initiation ATPase DnaA